MNKIMKMLSRKWNEKNFKNTYRIVLKEMKLKTKN